MSQTTTLTRHEHQELMEVLRGLDPTRRGLPKEFRRVRRRGVLEWMRIYTLPGAGQESPRVLRVLVKDVAGGGVGLFTRRVFADGSRFVLPVRFAEGGGRLYLCHTIFCRKSARHYSVGARFLASVEDPHADAGIPSEWLTR